MNGFSPYICLAEWDRVFLKFFPVGGPTYEGTVCKELQASDARSEDTSMLV